MWADTLLAAEQLHLHRLMLWGTTSALAGALLLFAAGRAQRSPLIFHFALQCIAWGGIDAALGAAGIHSLALRDLGAATQLDRFLWLNLGLDTGYVAVGATMALCGWFLGRRHGAVGAGAAVVLQGLALFLLDARFLLLLERFV